MRSSVLVCVLVVVCLAGVVRGDECTATGGKCLDNKTNTCVGGFVRGLCAGADNFRCCHGESKPKAAFVPIVTGSSPCAKQGGKCMDSRGNHCATGWKTGLCPGAAEIVCCPAEAAAAAVAPASPVSRSNAMPTFEKLVSCYPQGKAPEVKARLGGAINADWVTNTCAIRMSHTLNCAGKLIPQMGGESIRSAAKLNYIFRVRQLAPLMKKLFGPGITFKPASGSRGISVGKLTGRRGIIMFDTTGAWDDASGHFDLWDGKAMVEASHADDATVQRYFSLAISITLWPF